ncbi:hypothetical protein Ciccas_012743 [Cichlidogyrus casuarinus]|uniref:Uncharacterized protein n=1 Tax=Cichlidogyrus casuarinus TaxID=1844966 RepID=A0ABD2PPC6_9PLAT
MSLPFPLCNEFGTFVEEIAKKETQRMKEKMLNEEDAPPDERPNNKINLSNRQLSEDQKHALSLGFRFSIKTSTQKKT